MSRIPKGCTAVNIHYNLYLEQILRLVSSLVIKSEHAVRQMNTQVRLLGVSVNESLPHTWKYYMNMNGEYHPTDSPMYVTSQDTFEEIPFTKESLEDHLLTKRSYRELGRFYKSLVEAHPSQELLIRGILNPIGYNESIGARDHKILGYDSSLIEPQEQFLIPEIQDYIDGMYDKWYNIDYNRIEAVYQTYMDAMLFANLPMQIALSRKRRRYTDLAHSYHIRMYLLSFSKKIGDEFNYLSRPQRLWLYRNIKYLNLNIGTNETLDEVVRHIMNDRGFPVVATELEFDYENINKNLDPDINTYPLSLGYIEGESLNVGGVDDILARQLTKAPLNSDYREYDRERLEEKYYNNRFDKLTTKVLESNIIDRSDAEPFTFKSVVTNYWPFLAAKGMYNARLSITVPTTGDVHQLDMMDAFILYVYCITAFEDTFLENIPCFYIQHVLRPVPPKLADLEALRMDYTKRSFIEYINDRIPPLYPIISPLAFNEVSNEIHRVQNDLRRMRHLQGDYRVEGNLHQIIDKYFHSVILKPYDRQNFDSWFEEREIEIDRWLKEDYIEVAAMIFEQATGVSMNKGSALKDLHAAMVRVLDELTSYSVHMLTTTNDDGVRVLDTKFPKGTVPIGEENNSVTVDINTPTILRSSESLTHNVRGMVKVPTVANVVANDAIELYVPAGLSSRSSGQLYNKTMSQVSIPVIRKPKKAVIEVNQIDDVGESDIDYTIQAVEDNPLHQSVLDTYSQMTSGRMAMLLGS